MLIGLLLLLLQLQLQLRMLMNLEQMLHRLRLRLLLLWLLLLLLWLLIGGGAAGCFGVRVVVGARRSPGSLLVVTADQIGRQT